MYFPKINPASCINLPVPRSPGFFSLQSASHIVPLRCSYICCSHAGAKAVVAANTLLLWSWHCTGAAVDGAVCIDFSQLIWWVAGLVYLFNTAVPRNREEVSPRVGSITYKRMLVAPGLHHAPMALLYTSHGHDTVLLLTLVSLTSWILF